MPALYAILFLLLGLCCGTLVDILAYRIPRKKIFEKKVPYCPHCLTSHPPKYFIPILGYFLCKGRCESCSERLSPRKPIVETFIALVFMGLYFAYGLTWYLIPAFLLVAVLVLISCIDTDIMEIPNGLVLIILVEGIITFIASFFGFGFKWYDYLIGAVATSVPLFLIALFSGGIGGGDIKLLFAVGLFLGWQNVLVATVFGTVIGAIVGIVGIIVKGKGAKSKIPLGPSLALGIIITLFTGDYIIKAVADLFAVA